MGDSQIQNYLNNLSNSNLFVSDNLEPYKDNFDEFIINSEYNNFLIYSLTESHYIKWYLYDILDKISEKTNNINIFYIGNHYDSQILEYNTNKLHILNVTGSPFIWFNDDSDIVRWTQFDSFKISPIYKKRLFSALMYGKRIYRDYFFTKCFELGFKNNISYHSNSKQNQNHNDVTYSTFEEFSEINREIDFKKYEKFKINLPHYIDVNGFEIANHDYFESCLKFFQESLFIIVPETVFMDRHFLEDEDRYTQCVTEKLIFPFISNSIPLILHNYSIEIKNELKKLGFDMFDDIIPSEFYTINDIDKVDYILNFLKNYDVDINLIYNSNFQRFEHNKKVATQYLSNPIHYIKEKLNEYNLHI